MAKIIKLIKITSWEYFLMVQDEIVYGAFTIKDTIGPNEKIRNWMKNKKYHTVGTVLKSTKKKMKNEKYHTVRTVLESTKIKWKTKNTTLSEQF